MYYNISINQKAIVDFNSNFNANLDLIDATILEYLQKHCSNNFGRRNSIFENGEPYYLVSYDNMISQMPLLKIDNKEVIGRRLKKLEKLNIIKKKVSKIDGGTKVYYAPQNTFDSFFLSDFFCDSHPTQKSTPPDSKVGCIYIYDNNINDNKKNIKKENFENDFELFWQKYPKEGRTDKKLAKQKFILAREKKVPLETILNALDRYQKYLDSKCTETFKQSPKNPSTWLNQQCWEESYEIQEKPQEEKKLTWEETNKASIRVELKSMLLRMINSERTEEEGNYTTLPTKAQPYIEFFVEACSVLSPLDKIGDSDIKRYVVAFEKMLNSFEKSTFISKANNVQKAWSMIKDFIDYNKRY